MIGAKRLIVSEEEISDEEQHEALRAIAFSERRSLADVVRKAVAARPKGFGT